MNTASEDSSKRLIKGKVSQMSQSSRFCQISSRIPEGSRNFKMPVLSAGIPLCSGCPQAAPCKHRPLQKAALWLCGLLLSALRLSLPDGSLWLFKCVRFGKGAAEGSHTVGYRNRLEKVGESRQKGKFLPPGFGNAPEERTLGDLSFPRMLMQ